MSIDKNSIITSLQRWIDGGYLLHGSNKKFEVIRPNKRKKLDPRVGLLKAVYATDDPKLAMFLAILNYSRLPLINGVRKSMIGWYYDENDEAHFALTPNFFLHNAFNKGYIYVVHGSLFKSLKKLPHEYYAYGEIKPARVIGVSPQNFLTTVKTELYPVEGIRQAGFHTEEEISAMGYRA